MKILIISFSVNGAMGDNFKQVTKYLSLTNEVVVMTNVNVSHQGWNCSNIYEIGFNRAHFYDFINCFSYLKMYHIVRKTAFDVALFLSPHPANLYLYHIIPSRKIVAYVHDYELHSGVTKLNKYFNLLQLKYYYHRSRKIIVSCEYIKEQILKKKYMCRANDIEVNYLGLLENHIYPRIVNVVQDIDVLFFGRIEYYKGLDILVDSHRFLKNAGIRYTIIGKGDLKKVFNMDIPDFVDHINGYITDEELACYIQRAKMVVLPYRDATGTQTIQSVFYYKKPIIATKVGCFPEYISDQVDGFIVNYEDSIQLANKIDLLYQDETLRIKMGENGARKLELMFDNERINSRYIEICKSITNNS